MTHQVRLTYSSTLLCHRREDGAQGWAAWETEAGLLDLAPPLPSLPSPCMHLCNPVIAHPLEAESGNRHSLILLVPIPSEFCICDIIMFVFKISKGYNDWLITKIINLHVNKTRCSAFIEWYCLFM